MNTSWACCIGIGHTAPMPGEVSHMTVRDPARHEIPALWEIFWGAIHNVNVRDYSTEQVEAWAPTDLDAAVWQRKLEEIRPFVVEVAGQIVGYSDLQSNGLIDHLFVHHQWQGRGVARRLMQEIEQRASRRGLKELESHVSITARPFFEKYGFRVVREQDNELRGVILRNYLMRRQL